jgi:NAD(P)-dependent dehydrogenase (short-subunit alcohol dehydrogenase family)
VEVVRELLTSPSGRNAGESLRWGPIKISQLPAGARLSHLTRAAEGGAVLRSEGYITRTLHWRNGMDIDLAGRTAVVTGGSKGIGLEVVRRLAASGAQVIAGAKSRSPEIEELTRDKQVIFVEVDLADPGGPAQLVGTAGDRVDILVNNVGIARARPGGFLSITEDDWATSLTLNLMAAVRATRAALPGMLAAGAGAIVMTCSVNARLPDPAVLDYSAAKAGLAGFAKALSKEVGPHGIRVNTVSPGPVATDLWLGSEGVAATVSQATGAKPGDVESQAAGQSVTGRFSRPSEVADLILYLASDLAANITGSDFTIDGGLIPTL